MRIASALLPQAYPSLIPILVLAVVLASIVVALVVGMFSAELDATPAGPMLAPFRWMDGAHARTA